MDAMAPAAQLIDVSRRYGDVVALDGVSFALPKGQIIGLLGPNGSGKSTSIRILLGLLLPSSGKVELLGSRPDQRARSRVGYLPEQRGLYNDMEVHRLLAYFGELQGLSRSAAVDAADRWLTRLELSDRKGSVLETFSKGMQQKVQLATALVHDPALIILDEPFSGLDPVNQELFTSVFRERAEAGCHRAPLDP